MIIIGFGHKKRVGKDSAVQFALAFARQYFPSLQTGILSFGNELKDISYQMFKWGGLREAMYYENHPSEIDEILPIIGLSARQIWDKAGLFGRQIHPNIWVEMGIHNAPEADVLFCKDVRFPTEIQLIDKFKGFKYRIDRDGLPQGGEVDQALNDYTNWTDILHNNGTLREFNFMIKRLVCTRLNALVTIDKIVCPHCFSKSSRPAQGLATGLFQCSSCSLFFGEPHEIC